jgi:NitT/TauT family transport system ATP-binding protein
MIKLENISFSYDNEKIISELTAELKTNKVYCIMGPSGIGKTTFMNLISGLNTPDSGKITGTDKLKKSFIFQENRLLSHLSVYDNLRYVSNNEEKINKALIQTGLIEDKNKKITELSGGMARRTAIARATAFNGDIFFIDEPLYGLDTKTSQGILELIKDTVNDKTAFIITHSPEEAFLLADKIIFIKNKPISELEISDISEFSHYDEIRHKLLK